MPNHDTSRLAAVGSLVPAGSRVADIGSGHGRLARALLVTGRARRCVATERTEALVGKIGGFPPGHPLAGALELRHGDGLWALSARDRIEVVVVAGLGGGTLLRVLTDGWERLAGVRRVVLQPQTQVARLRSWLDRRRFSIVAEKMALDRGRFYVVLAAERTEDGSCPTHPLLAPGDLYEAGPCLVRSADPLVRRYWRGQLHRLEGIVRTAPRGSGRDRARRGSELARRVLSALDHTGPAIRV